MILHSRDRHPHILNPDLSTPDSSNPDSSNLSQSFWNRSAVGMYRASLNGHFLQVNPSYAEVLEYDSALQLVRGVTCIAYDVYQSPTRWSELLTYLHQERSIQGFESPVWTGKGTVRWVSECVRLVSDEQRGQYILEGIVHDITDRRRQALTQEWHRLNQMRDKPDERPVVQGKDHVREGE